MDIAIVERKPWKDAEEEMMEWTLAKIIRDEK